MFSNPNEFSSPAPAHFTSTSASDLGSPTGDCAERHWPSCHSESLSSPVLIGMDSEKIIGSNFISSSDFFFFLIYRGQNKVSEFVIGLLKPELVDRAG